MIKLKQYLKESPFAGYGNWNPKMEYDTVYSAFIIDAQWEHVGKTSKDLDIYRFTNSKDDAVIAGYFGEDRDEGFQAIARLDLKKEGKLGWVVVGVAIRDSLRGTSIATDIYKLLVNKLHYVLIGDETQFFGARRLWSKLSKVLDLTVDIIDIDSGEVLKRGYILHHGKHNDDFDKFVYTNKELDFSKSHIRPLLKKIK